MHACTGTMNSSEGMPITDEIALIPDWKAAVDYYRAAKKVNVCSIQMQDDCCYLPITLLFMDPQSYMC